MSPRTLLCALAVTGTLGLAAAGPAAAKPKVCSGTISFSGTKTTIRIVRGVSCSEAKRVAKAYDRGTPSGGYQCFITHAPFDHVGSKIVGFVCAKGGSGAASRRPHSFQGLVKDPT